MHLDGTVMKLELKNIKIFNALSEETTCFLATLHADDRKIECSNRGQGGSNEYSATVADINTWLIANNPPIEAYGMTMPYDLELWIDDQLGMYELAKELKRKLIYRLPNGKVYETKLTQEARHQVSHQYGDLVVILNDLPIEEAYHELDCA